MKVREFINLPSWSSAIRLAVGFMATFLTVAARADTIEERYSQHGTLILTQLVSAPFPHPARAEGHRYQNELYPADKHYADSRVAIFVPKGFHQTEQVDFVIHFHGWRNNVEKELAEFKFIEQFVASGRNAILILPQGPRDAPDSFGGRLEDEGGFKRFMDDVLGVLRAGAGFKSPAIGSIILSGHSGGYRVIAQALAKGGLAGRVKEVWLFDALYAETDKFMAWQKQTQGKLINIYTADGGTRRETEQLMAGLKKNGVAFLAKEAEAVTPDELRNQRLVFLFTKLGHNDVLEKRQTFREFLKASCLPPW